MTELKDFDINEFEIGQNLYIEASAGTGKTYTIELLVEKMLQKNIPLSKILIVTYTEKATGELRDRIRKKIINCLEKNPNDLIFTKALQEVGNAQIFTIHSFCQNVLDNFAFETKSSLNLELVNDNDIEDIVDRFIRDKWQKLDEFIKLLKYEDFKINDLKSECINAVKQYNLYINLSIEEIKDNDRKSLEQKFVLEHFQELIDEWQNYKKNNNLISFADMINLVHDCICGKNNGIATPLSEARPFRTSNDKYKNRLVERLREAYRYAIIDEFQDTNQKQWDTFGTIFLNGENNNIIVVGDPKQSIFSFQGAEIDKYKKAIDEIGNGRRLSTNYRSSDSMIEACNVIFNDKKDNFFGDSGIEFSNSNFPKNIGDNDNNKALLNNEEIEPIWLAEPSDGLEYARYAVSKMVECLKCDENGKTALQIYSKNENQMRSVKFSDFAVLTRTRPEMLFIEDEMRKIGIPFYRYKDASLFDGRECKEWISLLMLLGAPDFASYNRRILNQALLTDFFRVNVDDVESEEYVNPTKEPMSFILDWRRIAEKRLWAELKERIFEDTKIDEFLSKKSKSSNLVKIRQIANYIFDYLFNHKVSIEEMIKHLNGLASKTQETDSEGELVENANDFDAVRIMTIFASKGLEFPIVIMAGSLKKINNKIKGPFVYNKNQTKTLGFESSFKNTDTYTEWRRLIYVAYTRAKYILILPDFSQKSRGPWSGKTNFSFLRERIPNIRKEYFVRKEVSSYKLDEAQIIVKDFIEKNRKKENNSSTSEEADKQKQQIINLQKSLPSLRTYQLSYSSISSNLKGKYDNFSSDKDSLLQESLSEKIVISEDLGRLDKEDSIDDNFNENESFILEKFKNIDNSENIIKACSNYSSNINIENDSTDNYPKGARLGNAIHEILELLIFENYGKLNADEIYEISQLNNLIIERFEKQSLPIRKNTNWVKLTAKILWNTLNADLPVILGNKVIVGKTFKLKSLPDNARKAEVEFLFGMNERTGLPRLSARNDDSTNSGLDDFEAKTLKNLCKGFIDLLFVRKENGIDYYSILDWKSDYMSVESYSDGEALAEKVAEDYTVQRVLYSYLLIKWLKQFYSGLSEEEIFKQHFGGIYYAFVRGCRADSSNGIYAQTWKSYKALEESYRKLLKELRE